jgi:hypothetical protein
VTDPEYYDWIFAQRRDSNPHATAPR